MKEFIIMIGNIGTGKSTYIKKLIKKRYVVISRDKLRYMIGNGKYIFNLKLEPAIWKAELKIIEEFMKLRVNIIVDEVGVSESQRRRYFPLTKKYGYKNIAIIMPKLSMKECVDRRMNNPHQQYDRKLWETIWIKFNNLYTRPSKKEGFNKIIQIKRNQIGLK